MKKLSILNIAAATLVCSIMASTANAALILNNATYDTSNNLLDLSFTLSGPDVINANSGFTFDIDSGIKGDPANIFSTNVDDVSILWSTALGFTINAVDTKGGDSASFAYTGPQIANTTLGFIIDTGAANGFIVNYKQNVDFAINTVFGNGTNANLTANTHSNVGIVGYAPVSVPEIPTHNTVPEPTSVALLAAGIAGFRLASRKRLMG